MKGADSRLLRTIPAITKSQLAANTNHLWAVRTENIVRLFATWTLIQGIWPQLVQFTFANYHTATGSDQTSTPAITENMRSNFLQSTWLAANISWQVPQATPLTSLYLYQHVGLYVAKRFSLYYDGFCVMVLITSLTNPTVAATYGQKWEEGHTTDVLPDCSWNKHLISSWSYFYFQLPMNKLTDTSANKSIK